MFIDLIYPVGKHAKEGLNPFTHSHTHTHTPRFYSVYWWYGGNGWEEWKEAEASAQPILRASDRQQQLRSGLYQASISAVPLLSLVPCSLSLVPRV